MCDKCTELDEQIERYLRISSWINDQLTIDRIEESRMYERRKLRFTPIRKSNVRGRRGILQKPCGETP
jgi:hypothetical protein